MDLTDGRGRLAQDDEEESSRPDDSSKPQGMVPLDAIAARLGDHPHVVGPPPSAFVPPHATNQVRQQQVNLSFSPRWDPARAPPLLPGRRDQQEDRYSIKPVKYPPFVEGETGSRRTSVGNNSRPHPTRHVEQQPTFQNQAEQLLAVDSTTTANSTGALFTLPPPAAMTDTVATQAALVVAGDAAVTRKKRRRCSQCNKLAVQGDQLCRVHGGKKRCRSCGSADVKKGAFCVLHGGSAGQGGCQYDGCERAVRGNARFCGSHSGGRICEFEGGCSKSAARSSKFCIEHGGGQRCADEDCDMTAVGGARHCRLHGGGLCQFESGCAKVARSGYRFCRTHGGGASCKHDGCNSGAKVSGYCISHGGGRRCEQEACTRAAAGSTRFCIVHGGGRRCQFVGGCSKGAAGSTDFCKRHGGGRRCQFDGCEKSAKGTTFFCISHGGGPRCVEKRCGKSAVGKTKRCIAHGGGVRCHAEGCKNGASGTSRFCISHGGGKRCQRKNCDRCVTSGSSFCSQHSQSMSGKVCQYEGCMQFALGKQKFCSEQRTGRTDGPIKKDTCSARSRSQSRTTQAGGSRTIPKKQGLEDEIQSTSGGVTTSDDWGPSQKRIRHLPLCQFSDRQQQMCGRQAREDSIYCFDHHTESLLLGATRESVFVTRRKCQYDSCAGTALHGSPFCLYHDNDTSEFDEGAIGITCGDSADCGSSVEAKRLSHIAELSHKERRIAAPVEEHRGNEKRDGALPSGFRCCETDGCPRAACPGSPFCVDHDGGGPSSGEAGAKDNDAQKKSLAAEQSVHGSANGDRPATRSKDISVAAVDVVTNRADFSDEKPDTISTQNNAASLQTLESESQTAAPRLYPLLPTDDIVPLKPCQQAGCLRYAQPGRRLCWCHAPRAPAGLGVCHRLDVDPRNRFDQPSFMAHDIGGRHCNHDGCEKMVSGNTPFCRGHGGGTLCAEDGCNGAVAGRAESYCRVHGGGKRCQREECNKLAVAGRTKFCIKHGGGNRCKVEGCNKGAASGGKGTNKQYCIKHGGGRRCQKEGCASSGVGPPQGDKWFCKKHGGGRRCQHDGCGSAARPASAFCIRHNGGYRCSEEGCERAASGSTSFCISHGGGRRCQAAGGLCENGAQGRTNFCIKHGGGRRCSFENCGRSSYGSEMLCVRHGGGPRCPAIGCSKSVARQGELCNTHYLFQLNLLSSRQTQTEI